MQTVKQSLRAARGQGIPLDQALSEFLLRYRCTPHATTGTPPCNLMLGRRLRTRLDQLKPDLSSRVRQQQCKQKEQHDMHSHGRQFTVGDIVWVKNFREGSSWISGTVVKVTAPVSYCVHVGNGNVWRRHVDHIRSGTTEGQDGLSDVSEPAGASEEPESPSSNVSASDSANPPVTTDAVSSQDIRPACEQPRFVRSPYPTRQRFPPDRYGH